MGFIIAAAVAAAVIVRANSIEAKTDRNITIKTEPEDEE